MRHRSLLRARADVRNLQLVDEPDYVAAPFVNQCFFVAISAWIKGASPYSGSGPPSSDHRCTTRPPHPHRPLRRCKLCLGQPRPHAFDGPPRAKCNRELRLVPQCTGASREVLAWRRLDWCACGAQGCAGFEDEHQDGHRWAEYVCFRGRDGARSQFSLVYA